MYCARLSYLLSWLVLICTIFTTKKLCAQEPAPVHFEHFGINDGLSQGYVGSILQDRQGFMWFGTSDGLNKYDGYSFFVYRHDPANPNSPSGDDITCLFEDSKQRLWIGYRGKGIDIFDKDKSTFTHIRHFSTPGLRSDFILNIYEDRSGAIWVRNREGLDRIELRKDTAVFTPIIMDSVYGRLREVRGAEGFLVDSRNRKFITTNYSVSELFFNDSLRTYKVVERFRFGADTAEFVGALMDDTINHCIYLNTGRQVYKFPDYKFSDPRSLGSYDGAGIHWTMDLSHHLWMMGKDHISEVNTRYKRVRRIVADHPEHQKILETGNVFFTDRTGVVWIGSGGYGIIKYDPATAGFHHLMRDKNVYQILENSDGSIITNDLNHITITEDSVVNKPGYVNSRVIAQKFNMVFAKDSSDDLWFPRNGVLWHYQAATKTEVKVPIPFTDFVSLPFPLIIDKNNNIWMGYNRYLVKYEIKTGTFSKYPYPRDVIQFEFDYLQNIFYDEGLLWLGTINGLICFDIAREKMLKTYVNKENDSTSISNNVVFSFASDVEEPERYLWIGTKGGGLNRLDKTTGKFIHYNTRQGLSNNVIYGILPDFSGHLWLSTNKGLSSFNLKEKTFLNFDVSDGLQSNEFNRYASLRTSEGVMIFGGLNGINYFRSDEIRPLDPPRVVFTDFKLSYKSVIPGTPNSPLRQSISSTKHIELNHNQNNILFQFAATDYRKRGSIRYRFQMQQFDEDWIYSGAAHEATYTNLDPGTYHFRVQASFENGEWSTETAVIELYISTPWYNTWWFYSILFAVVGGATFALYRFRIAQLHKLEKLRNRIARDLHDEVGSSVSTIAIYSKIVQEQMDSVTFNKEPLLKKINDFATEIMINMNDIVWSINVKNDAFEQIVSRMRENAIQLFEAKGSRLHFDFDDTVLRFKLAMERRREFYLIYKEALNNTAKYAEAENVWIVLSASENRITLKIRDDGKGFDIEKNRKGGNGLNNMQQRANALQGKLTISSGPDAGTELTLVFLAF